MSEIDYRPGSVISQLIPTHLRVAAGKVLGCERTTLAGLVSQLAPPGRRLAVELERHLGIKVESWDRGSVLSDEMDAVVNNETDARGQ